jgi:hypothetical protein
MDATRRVKSKWFSGICLLALVGMAALTGCQVGDDPPEHGSGTGSSSPCLTVPSDRPPRTSPEPQMQEPGAAASSDRICDPWRPPLGDTARAPDAGAHGAELQPPRGPAHGNVR